MDPNYLRAKVADLSEQLEDLHKIRLAAIELLAEYPEVSLLYEGGRKLELLLREEMHVKALQAGRGRLQESPKTGT